MITKKQENIQNLIAQKISGLPDSKTLKAIENKPRPEIFLTDEEAREGISKIALGKIYLGWDESKIPVLAEIENFMTDFKKGKKRGFLIMGSFGTGKTTLLHYLAYRLLRVLRTSGYGWWNPLKPEEYVSQKIYLSERIEILRVSKVINILLSREWDQIDNLERTSILMLDDLARFYADDLAVAKLVEFIQFRYDNLLPTFITSDISYESMLKKPNWQAMIDRFSDSKWMGPALILAGGSLRK